MRKRVLLQTAVLLSAVVNFSYVEASCWPPKPGETPLEVLECLQSELDTQQKRIAVLEKENQRLRELAALPEKYQNVRALLTKAHVDNICPNGTKAAHVPLSYRGKTGNEICAANNGREEKSCQSVKYIYVRNNNSFGDDFSRFDKTCQSSVVYPWPWGRQRSVPNTYSIEWGHGDTWVVCCKH